MTRRSWIQFFLLSAMWGASYLFIKVALEDVSPAMVVFARTALASLVLLPFALRADALSGLRQSWPAFLLLALIQVAAPFMLISIGQQEISSSLAGHPRGHRADLHVPARVPVRAREPPARDRPAGRAARRGRAWACCWAWTSTAARRRCSAA